MVVQAGHLIKQEAAAEGSLLQTVNLAPVDSALGLYPLETGQKTELVLQDPTLPNQAEQP